MPLTASHISEYFNQFTRELYDEDNIKDHLPGRELFESFVSEFIKHLKEENPKKSSGRAITKPGDAFNQELCHCRVWNKGFGKQCSSKKVNGEYCTMHFKKIEEYLKKNPKENKLKPVFEALDGAVEYGKIRLVMEYLKN